MVSLTSRTNQIFWTKKITHIKRENQVSILCTERRKSMSFTKNLDQLSSFHFLYSRHVNWCCNFHQLSESFDFYLLMVLMYFSLLSSGGTNLWNIACWMGYKQPPKYSYRFWIRFRLEKCQALDWKKKKIGFQKE